MKTIHDKGKDFTEYKLSGSYQDNSLRADLTEEKVMRGEGALLVYATTVRAKKNTYNIHVIICERNRAREKMS